MCFADKPKTFVDHSNCNPLVDVTFAVSCERVSNCSSHGNCTGPNVCDCQNGYKSIGCAQGNIIFFIETYEHCIFLNVLAVIHVLID